MEATAVHLCQEIGGAQLAVTQSDEISLLVVDYTLLDKELWFGGNLQKIVSVAASAATAAFNARVQAHSLALPSWAMVDARAFVIPREDVVNYFIWRQQDGSSRLTEMTTRYGCISQIEHFNAPNLLILGS